jgi:hypothetical protein
VACHHASAHAARTRALDHGVELHPRRVEVLVEVQVERLAVAVSDFEQHVEKLHRLVRIGRCPAHDIGAERDGLLQPLARRHARLGGARSHEGHHLEPQPVVPAAAQREQRLDAAVQRLGVDVRVRPDGDRAAREARRNGALGACSDVLDAHSGGIAAEGVDRTVQVALRVLDARQRARLVEVLVRIHEPGHHQPAAEIDHARRAARRDAGGERLNAAVVADQQVEGFAVDPRAA